MNDKPEFKDVTPDDVQKIAEQGGLPSPYPEPVKAPAVRMQHVFITLADGRRGVFMGPELIKAIEFQLGMIPRPTAIDFEPPREFTVPVAHTPEEPVNADQKTDDQSIKPASDVGETA